MLKLRLAAGAKHVFSIPSCKPTATSAELPPSPGALRLTARCPNQCTTLAGPSYLVAVRASSGTLVIYKKEVTRPGTVILGFSPDVIDKHARAGIEIEIAAGPCGFQGEVEFTTI